MNACCFRNEVQLLKDEVYNSYKQMLNYLKQNPANQTFQSKYQQPFPQHIIQYLQLPLSVRLGFGKALYEIQRSMNAK
jgi:hypothetical protein